MFGLITSIFSQYKVIAIVVLVVAFLGMAGTIKYQNWRIGELNKDNGRLQEQYDGVQQRMIEEINSSNQRYMALQKDVMEERLATEKALMRIEEMNGQLQQTREQAEEYKSMYEGDRLSRLSEAKGGLLTRLSKSAALKRNEEWENALQ